MRSGDSTGILILAQGRGSPAFYTTATAVLAALLLTWLAAEARSARDEKLDERAGRDSLRVPTASLVPIAVGLCIGIVAAFRAQYRGHAEAWETAAVWAALALGLCSVALSLVLATREASVSDTARSASLSGLRRWGALVVALAVGIVASPLVCGGTTTLAGARFAVYGTCLSGGCGLHLRSGPGANHPRVKEARPLADGELVFVVCQAEGQAPFNAKSRVWDKLADGAYVSDAFVDTPNRGGGFSEGLPRC